MTSKLVDRIQLDETSQRVREFNADRLCWKVTGVLGEVIACCKSDFTDITIEARRTSPSHNGRGIKFDGSTVLFMIWQSRSDESLWQCLEKFYFDYVVMPARYDAKGY